MDDNNPESRTIAKEAVGERAGDVIPDAVKDEAEKALEKAKEVVGQATTQAGSSTAAKAAEAINYAYSDTEKTGDAVQQAARQVGSQACDVADEMLAAGRQAAQVKTRPSDERPFLTLLAGFGLGYIAGLLIHGRR